MLNLPLPLPIREPITFFVKGVCGNALNHILRLVSSLRLAAFFKKSFKRNIFLLFKRKGCCKTKPAWPKIILLGFNFKNFILKFNFTFLDFWRDLNLNFLGCNTTKTKEVWNNLEDAYTKIQEKIGKTSSTKNTPFIKKNDCITR